ncbi:MAG: hypothetical protein HY007_03320 [Candidatus Sungbacteria bacterium]|nr:hypothetical protein [Candidatus Sungbacteria bacterium]
MSRTFNQKIMRILVFLACLGILVFLALHFMTIVRQGKQKPQLPADAGTAPEKPSVNIQNTQTQAVPQNNPALSTINYRDHRFTPLTTTLEQNAKGTGCVIRIVNQSNTPLMVRLSPHEKALKGNYGGQYDPIGPGKSIIIDPRFDMGYESFHNFNAPSEEFHVRLTNSCRSDL